MSPTPTVHVMTATDLEDRRRALLSAAGCSLHDLRVRAHEYELSLDELEVLRELERIEFLSGN